MKKCFTTLFMLFGALSLDAEAADTVKFVSVPLHYGITNVQYEYTALAQSSDPLATFKYYGGLKGEGGVIVIRVDSVSGRLEWTPAKRGIYLVSLLAISSVEGHAFQEFAIVVTNGNGIIQGKVSDTLNAGIPNIIVEVFNTVSDSSLSFAYANLTDVNGNYRISHVDPGSYKLRASSPSGNYESQWYEGKPNVLEGDVISIADSPAVTFANFKLRGGNATRPKVTITGKVTDTLGLAISNTNCRVVFVRAEFALNFGGGFSALEENFRKYFELNAHADFRLDGNSEFVFKTDPDSITGEYEIQLPIGRYIAFARAGGYAVEFFHNASNLLSADMIPIPLPPTFAPVSIDFSLTPLPPAALGGISGFVYENNIEGIPVPARVIAFRDRWRRSDFQRTARVYVTDTDSLGKYSFNELLPGMYIVMAVPLGDYSPSFHTWNAVPEHRWISAAPIEIDGNSLDNINISVKPFGTHANGYTSIYGNVTMSGSNGDGMTQGSLKAGALVYAAHEGWISGYAITDAEGNYTIAGLAPGEYDVFVDKPGFNESDAVKVSVGYSPSGAPASGSSNFIISGYTQATGYRTSDAIRPGEYALAQNYPNPFNPSTTISYTQPNSGMVTLKVYDLLGKEVVTLVNKNQNAGKYDVSFNASKLPTGVYFYRFQSGGYHTVKKMILIK